MIAIQYRICKMLLGRISSLVPLPIIIQIDIAIVHLRATLIITSDTPLTKIDTTIILLLLHPTIKTRTTVIKGTPLITTINIIVIKGTIRHISRIRTTCNLREPTVLVAHSSRIRIRCIELSLIYLMV